MVGLWTGSSDDAMHASSKKTAAKLMHTVSKIDNRTAFLGLDVGPAWNVVASIALGRQDLKTAEDLVKEKRHATVIGVRVEGFAKVLTVVGRGDCDADMITRWRIVRMKLAESLRGEL